MSRVSVIIPTRNRPRLLARAVESARSAGEGVEIIVVDDASADATAEVCRGMEGIRYIRLERNQGVAGARNVGLLASSADYVAFLDDDDLRLPGSLDRQREALEARPEAGFACGPALYADQSGGLTGSGLSPREPEGGDAFWQLLEWDFFVLPVTALVRKRCLLSAGLLRKDLARIDDWDLWVRLAELFPVVTVGEPVGVYRLPTPSSDQNTSHLAPDFVRALRRQEKLLRLPRAQAAPARRRAETRRRTRARFADVLLHQAATRLPEGACGFAWRNLVTALRLSPPRVARPYVYKELWKQLRARGAKAVAGGAAARAPRPEAEILGRRSAPVVMTETGPRVSVIIPTHNRPHLLPRAVASAQAAGTDVEVIVVDDASDAETARVCRDLAGVRYLRAERNQKLGGARNIGIVASRGEFISFLDDDDLRLPGSLDLQAEVLERAPEVGLVYGQAWLADQGGERTGEFYPAPCPRGDIFWELLENNFIPCPTSLFRRSCLLRVGMPSDSLPGVEDWDLWLRIAELYPVEAVERKVAVYRQATPSSDQLTSATAEMIALVNRAYRTRWMKLPRAAGAPAARRREALRRFSGHMTDVLLHQTGRALAARYFRRAQQNVATALRWHPLTAGRKIVDTSGARQFLGGALHERRLAARDRIGLGRGPAGGGGV